MMHHLLEKFSVSPDIYIIVKRYTKLIFKSQKNYDTKLCISLFFFVSFQINDIQCKFDKHIIGLDKQIFEHKL